MSCVLQGAFAKRNLLLVIFLSSFSPKMDELAVLYFYVLGGVLSGVGYYFLEHGEEELGVY